MALDDYYVVIYRILNYLYDSLKKGLRLDIINIKNEINASFNITPKGIDYIFNDENMKHAREFLAIKNIP